MASVSLRILLILEREICQIDTKDFCWPCWRRLVTVTSLVCMYSVYKKKWMCYIVAHKLTHWFCYHNLLIVISATTSTGSLFDLFELAFSQISLFLSISLSFPLSNAIQYMISWLSINDSTNTSVLILYLAKEKSETNHCWSQTVGWYYTTSCCRH